MRSVAFDVPMYHVIIMIGGDDALIQAIVVVSVFFVVRGVR
jgi:hypothetical protein